MIEIKSDKHCVNCNDGDGVSVYPYYGVAPHECYFRKKGGFDDNKVGESTLTPKEEWPDNFQEDPDVAGLGVYTHCLDCGAGMNCKNTIE